MTAVTPHIDGYEFPGHRGYDRRPAIRLGPEHPVLTGADAWARVARLAKERGGPPLVAIDTYPGTDMGALRAELAAHLPGYRIEDVEEIGRAHV